MILRMVFLTIIAANFLGCSDLITEKYSNLDEAVKAGAITRGWLPTFVPKTATDIILVNDLDTNHQWLKFRIPIAQISTMNSDMQIMSLSDARHSGTKRPTAVGNWPPELKEPMLSTPRASFRFFRAAVASRYICLAVDSSTGEVFGWTCE